MLSLIEVRCPHCGAVGKIMQPPAGAILMGPCPECQGMVAFFGGQVFPLDRDIMVNGSNAQRREHLMEVIGAYVMERIVQLFDDHDTPPTTFDPVTAHEGHALKKVVPISEDEVRHFVTNELPKLDDHTYFRSIFGKEK